MNQAINTKVIYSMLHIKKQAFKMYYNDLEQDVIEWKGNKIVVGKNAVWLNGNIIEDMDDVLNFIKVGA